VEAVEGRVVVVLAKILLDRAQHEAVPFAIEAIHLLTGGAPGKAQDAEETERESGAHEWAGAATCSRGRRKGTILSTVMKVDAASAIQEPPRAERRCGTGACTRRGSERAAPSL